MYNSWRNSRNEGGKFSLNTGVGAMVAESGWEAREMKNDDNYDDGDGREA